jgi:nucleoside 2-deoxyribosyltransferase
MPKKTFYLAHPFMSRKEIREWELNSLNKIHNINTINPFYHPDSFDKFNERDIADNKYYKRLNYEKLVNTDIDLIQGSDGIVVIIDGKISYGTIQEMVYAALYCKPVYTIITNKQDKHPWLKYHSTKIFKSRKDFEDYITKNKNKFQ